MKKAFFWILYCFVKGGSNWLYYLAHYPVMKICRFFDDSDLDEAYWRQIINAGILFLITVFCNLMVVLSVVNCFGLYLLIPGYDFLAQVSGVTWIIWPWYGKLIAFFFFPFFWRLQAESGLRGF